MDFCDKINRSVNFLVQKIATIFRGENQITKKYLAYWTSYISITFFCIIGTLFLYTVCGTIIPFELKIAESYLFVYIRVFITCWAVYSTLFHYYMAITIQPFHNPGKPTSNICEKCNHWKSKLTFHCKSCDKCIWKRDHHCPWIGQCVGAHNQTHFFLFLLHFYIGTGLLLFFAPSFWVDHFSNFTIYDGFDGNIGISTRGLFMNKLGVDVMQFVNCKHGFLPSLMIAVFVVLHFCLLSFLLTYVFMVSDLKNIVKNLFFAKKLDENGKPEQLKNTSFAMIKMRWRAFLGMKKTGGSVLERIFVPIPSKIEVWI